MFYGMRSIALAMVFSCLACAKPVLSPGDFSVVEESYGLYTRTVSPNFSHEATTQLIPCRLDQYFGSTLVLATKEKQEAILPIIAEWTFTPIPGYRDGSDRVLDGAFPVPGKAHVYEYGMLFQLNDPEELIEDTYTLRIFDASSGRTYLRREFLVSGCEQPDTRTSR